MIKPVMICINFLVYKNEKLIYFTPISTVSRKKKIIEIANSEIYQSDNGILLNVEIIKLTKQQY